MTDNVNITVLIENTGDDSFVCEHGLSLFIETDNKKILLDAGSTDAFLENASELMIKPEEADFCVLSHGHYDHSGGFKEFLSRNNNQKVYEMEGFDGNYYSASGGNIHYIGVPEYILENFKDNFITINKFTEISDGIYLVPHTTKELEKIGERAKLYIKKNNEFLPDDFSHELSLVIDTKKGLVIFNSCSHSGMENIVNEVKNVLPGKHIYAFFGGLHMKGKKDGKEICNFSDEQLDDLKDLINKENIDIVYTGHCTGKEGYEKLEKRVPDKLFHLTTGRNIFI